MKGYGVKDVVKLSGVSARTLHYYDQIGLLKPLRRTEAGYRHYGKDQLLRLQQILFYKELDFSLKDIVAILDEPHFSLIEALEGHKTALKARQKRIAHLLQTIDETIHHLKEGNHMSDPQMLYEGLPKEMGTTHRQAAIQEYGEEAIHKAEGELLKLGKAGFKDLKAEWKKINDELFAARHQAPESTVVQLLIARHYRAIRQFWGTSQSADTQADAYAGLGSLYTHDERFTMRDGQPQPIYAQFLQKAMKYYAETQLK